MESNILMDMLYSKIGVEEGFVEAINEKKQYVKLYFREPGYKRFMEIFDYEINDKYVGMKFIDKEEIRRFKEIVLINLKKK